MARFKYRPFAKKSVQTMKLRMGLLRMKQNTGEYKKLLKCTEQYYDQKQMRIQTDILSYCIYLGCKLLC